VVDDSPAEAEGRVVSLLRVDINDMVAHLISLGDLDRLSGDQKVKQY
jgi:hypothetical protein